MYRALETAFGRAGVSWADCDNEDRGDGVLVLIPPTVAKALLVDPLPDELAAALREYNDGHRLEERIRLRMVLHAGEVQYDDHGVVADAVNFAFRLLDAPALKEALAESSGVLALIMCEWFFTDVVWHGHVHNRGAYRQVRVVAKEVDTEAWICLPDAPQQLAPGSGLPALSPAVRHLLRAQRILAEELPYRVLLHGPQPALSAVYVDQRAAYQAEPDQGKDEGPGASKRTRKKATTPAAGPVRVESVVRTIPELLRSQRHALVVGEPGSGKSTLLQHLVGESARWWLSASVDADRGAAPFGPVMPVRVPASALLRRPLKEALTSHLSTELGAYLDRSFTPDLFMGPPAIGASWLLLVDGLDEIMDSRERAALIGALAEHVTRQGDFDGNFRLLVTSRPLPEQELAPLRISGIGDWRLRPFEPRDLEAFANGWFRARRCPDVETEVKQFLNRVERSQLQAIVRIPLLAVITAIVHEHTGGRALPVGQAALYEEFLRYLLQIRQETVQSRLELRERLARYTVSGDDLADWLVAHVRRLLEHLAAELLDGHEATLPDLAARWVAEHRPDLPRLVPDWRDRVLDLLRGTGVLLEREGSIQFLHHSFAEYLSAGPAAEHLDPTGWRRMVLDPARRNRALFTLARWGEAAGHNPTVLVEPLLRQRDDDHLLAAAAVLAHGVRLSPATEAAIIAALLGAACGIYGRADFFAALRALPGRPAVIDGLASLMANPAAAPATRVQAARSHAMLTDPAAALSTLTGIAGDRLCDANDRVGAAEALAELGERAPAIASLTAIVHDPTVAADRRVTAAVQLAHLDEASVAREVLASIAHDPASRELHRVSAATALNNLGENGAGTRVLLGVLDDPRADGLARIWAAEEIAKLGKADLAVAVLLAIARDPGTSVFQRATAAERLAGLNQRAAAIAVLAELARVPTAWYDRVEAARRLAELGEQAMARAILEPIARARGGWNADRVRAARELADAGDRDSAVRILRHLARSVRSGTQTRLDAARGLAHLGQRAEASAVLSRITRSWRGSARDRAYAADSLGWTGDLIRARAALTRLALAWYASGGSRALAARYLANLGERGLAVTVLRRIAGSRRVGAQSRAEAAESLAGLGEREHALAVLRQVAQSPRYGIRGTFARTHAARALANLGERDLALRTLNDIIGFAASDSLRARAATTLADIGDRAAAQRELANIVQAPWTTPDHRLGAARDLSTRWGSTMAATLLTAIADKRTAGTRNRIRAARDLAKIKNSALAVATLRAMATNNAEHAHTRLAAAAVLGYWRVRRYLRLSSDPVPGGDARR